MVARGRWWAPGCNVVAKGDGVSAIARMRHDERVGLERGRIVALFSELGPAGAERLISAAMEDLAVQMSRIEAAAFQGDLSLIVLAEDLAQLACQIGLSMLAGVGRDVAGCAAAGDGVALAATLARLQRVGARSLMAVWDLQDLRPDPAG